MELPLLKYCCWRWCRMPARLRLKLSAVVESRAQRLPTDTDCWSDTTELTVMTGFTSIGATATATPLHLQLQAPTFRVRLPRSVDVDDYV
ncbi:GD18574 [Drosophila simulans]|uniref:GD18574 n=1 Tax=Drosophila simulans TaxID=7240 RepID=B4QXX5_DROSI|nr:GD18574 [Drosophila simulans]